MERQSNRHSLTSFVEMWLNRLPYVQRLYRFEKSGIFIVSHTRFVCNKFRQNRPREPFDSRGRVLFLVILRKTFRQFHGQFLLFYTKGFFLFSPPERFCQCFPAFFIEFSSISFGESTTQKALPHGTRQSLLLSVIGPIYFRFFVLVTALVVVFATAVVGLTAGERFGFLVMAVVGSPSARTSLSSFCTASLLASVTARTSA